MKVCVWFLDPSKSTNKTIITDKTAVEVLTIANHLTRE